MLHKRLRKAYIINFNSRREEGSDVSISETGYPATDARNIEEQVFVLLSISDKLIYIRLDGFHATLHGRDSIALPPNKMS